MTITWALRYETRTVAINDTITVFVANGENADRWLDEVKGKLETAGFRVEEIDRSKKRGKR